MKKFDLYGQLILILLSYLPFISIFWYEYEGAFLGHGLFLIMLAIWQIISTLKNIVDYDDRSETNLFSKNLQIATVYFISFFCCLFLFQLSTWFMVSSLLLADILIIRYWVILKKHYQL